MNRSNPDQMKKRRAVGLTCLLLALLIPFGTGARTIADALAPLAAYRGGQPYRMTLAMDVAAWPDLAATSLNAMRRWLSGAALELSLRESEGVPEGVASLRAGKESVLTLGTSRDALTLEIPGALPLTRYVPGTQAAAALLPGTDAPLPDLPAAARLARQAAGAFLPMLEPYGKAVKGGVSIKNAGTANSRVEYSLTAQEAQAVWDAAKGRALPLLSGMMEALGMGEGSHSALAALEFTKNVTIKRYLDAQGADMGLQVTGSVLWNGAQRRVTLYGGVSSKGAYASLKFPALSGRDTLEAQVSLRFSESRVRGDWRLKARTGMEEVEASGKADLKAAEETGGTRLTGSLIARIRLNGEDALDWSAKPDLLFSGTSVEGAVLFNQSRGRKAVWEFTIRLSAAPASWPEQAEPLSETDLGMLGAAETQRLSVGIAAALARPIRDFLLTLPLPERLVLLHDMGRTLRTLGDTVPAPEIPSGSFTVSDIADVTP